MHNATTAFLHEILLQIQLIFSRMAAEEGDETGMKIVKKSFEYGYGKVNDDNFYQQKTSWSLTPMGMCRTKSWRASTR